MKKFTVHVIHVPTGKRTTQEHNAHDRREMLSDINHWNREAALGGEVRWHYWLEPNECSRPTWALTDGPRHH